MKYFAELDTSNVVIRVIVLADEDSPTELSGIAFCQSLYGVNTQWIETSHDPGFRGKFAGVGCTYDPQADEFVAPVPESEPEAPVNAEPEPTP